MSKLRNPIGEEAGDMAGEENNGDGWGSENVQEEHASRITKRNQVMRCDQRFKPENKLEKHEFTVHNKEISVHAIRQDFPEPLQ